MENQRASETPNVDKLSPEVRQEAMQAGSSARGLMDRASAHRQESGGAGSDHAGGREALMHTQGAPGQSQEALSPTDSHKGQTQSQQRTQSRGRGMER
jgi:hypothetical protein